MESVRENSVAGMSEMRAMIGLLRQEGDEAESETTRPRLGDADPLVERVRQAGMDVRSRIEGEPRELPPSVDLAGYRILQEALTNAMKHGESPVSVVVGYERDQVVLRVDNTLSADRRGGLPGAGAGLIGMRERAALVGGRFEAGAVDGQGWRVSATLPTTELNASPSRAWSDSAAEKKNAGGGR